VPRSFAVLPLLLAPLLMAGCTPSYSPNTYAAAAAQQAAPVDRAVIVGVRRVLISANGTVGAVTGGAAGGVAGAQAPGGSLGEAFGAIGGTLVGGLVGTAAEQTVADAKGWEYIVQEANGHLLSVTQTDKVPLPIGLHVLVIAGKQARIVPDYTVQVPAPKPAAKPTPNLAAAPIYISPLPLAAGALPPPSAMPPRHAAAGATKAAATGTAPEAPTATDPATPWSPAAPPFTGPVPAAPPTSPPAGTATPPAVTSPPTTP
jgi:outer membrane lipoprotein SlyB